MSSVQIPENHRCAFCEYLQGTRPYTILERTPLTATLVTREQRGLGHVLVVPVEHYPTILELGDDIVVRLAVAVRNAARLIEKAYLPVGIAVWQNNGVAAAQTIAHVHFHVAGTYGEQGTDFGPVRELSVGETDEIASRLNSHR